MKTIELINFIETHNEFTTIVIRDMDDKTPIQAISYLSSESVDNDWSISRYHANGKLQQGVLLVYNQL